MTLLTEVLGQPGLLGVPGETIAELPRSNLPPWAAGVKAEGVCQGGGRVYGYPVSVLRSIPPEQREPTAVVALPTSALFCGTLLFCLLPQDVRSDQDVPSHDGSVAGVVGMQFLSSQTAWAKASAVTAPMPPHAPVTMTVLSV